MARKATNSTTGATRYWLFKSEPNCFSIDDLAKAPKQTTFWDGIRNYQARNFLRDDIHPGHRVLYYHSSADPMAIVGTAEVVKGGYADHTQFDSKADHYDESSDPDDPTWFMVDVKLIQKFPQPITREMLAADKRTAGMMVMKRGSRLSIQPVTAEEWKAVHALAGAKDPK